MSPFFSRQLGAMIVDEMCQCGHLHSEHGSKLEALGKDKKLRMPNEGSCCAKNCECLKFRWKRWITANERRPLQVC